MTDYNINCFKIFSHKDYKFLNYISHKDQDWIHLTSPINKKKMKDSAVGKKIETLA